MRKRRWRLRVILATLVVLVVLAAWLKQHSHRPSANKTISTVIPSEAQPLPRLPPTAPESSPTPTVIDVCGMGKVSLDSEDTFGGFKSIYRTVENTRDRWLAAMLGSGDARTHATGLFLENKLSFEEFLKPPPQKTVDSLVQIALDSKDPEVYALAIDECTPSTGYVPSGACEQISVDTWTKMDGENAASWLALAAKAHAAGDSEAENAAYAQAAKAKTFIRHYGSLLSNAAPFLPADTTPLERYVLTTNLVGIESAIPNTAVYASRHCSVEAVSDATVRSQCSALAELFISQGSTLIERALGTLIGSRVGWTEERVSVLQNRLDALKEIDREITSQQLKDMWSCDSISRANAFLNERAHSGEIAAQEHMLERSGKTLRSW